MKGDRPSFWNWRSIVHLRKCQVRRNWKVTIFPSHSFSIPSLILSKCRNSFGTDCFDFALQTIIRLIIDREQDKLLHCISSGFVSFRATAYSILLDKKFTLQSSLNKYSFGFTGIKQKWRSPCSLPVYLYSSLLQEWKQKQKRIGR